MNYDDLFKDDDDKAYMTFTFKNCGKTVTLDTEYYYDVTWQEVLEDIVQCMEGHWGYKFRIDADELGIYCPEKDNNDLCRS